MFPSFDFGNRTTYEVQPPSERSLIVSIYNLSNLADTQPVLSRVQAFLPELEASNSRLAQRVQADPKSVDIEHVDEGMDQYIEMVRPLFFRAPHSLTESNRTLVSGFLKIVLTRKVMKMKMLRCHLPRCPHHQSRKTTTQMLTQTPHRKSSPRLTPSDRSSRSLGVC